MYEKIAADLPAGTTARADATIKAGQLRLQIDQLSASSNVLEDRFRNIAEGDFTQFLDDLVSRSKSAKQAFADFARSITADIARIANRNIAEAIFGKSGAGGALPAWFAALFGGGSSSTSGLAAAGAAAGGFVPPGGGFASGTNFAPGGLSLVGERGPEVVYLPRGAQVIPNDKVASGRRGSISVVNNITVPGNVTTATASQIAMQTAAAVQRAVNRNG